MERESFENEAIAAQMNESFVCIKVDREERPDLDEIYMAATVALSGSGGWPMTVFLTPEQQPFFAGTYFPPVDKYGRPGFPDLAREHRAAVAERSARACSSKPPSSPSTLPSKHGLRRRWRSVVRPCAARPASCTAATTRATAASARRPNSRPAQPLSLLLRHHRHAADASLREMITCTLDGMKNGGIYDHVGGGFARYSTDERWLVPHFEKMLYDNAQLASVYLEAYQVTRDPEYARGGA